MILPKVLGIEVISNRFKEEDEIALDTANELGIPIVNTLNEVFIPHSDIMSLFPLQLSGNHYSAKGYRLVAEAISKRLKSDGITPIN